MSSSSKYIYFDHSATTPVLPEVVEKINQCLLASYGNPSEGHRLGKEARQLVERAQQQIASSLGANPSEIIFTSGGTESNNLAIFGVAEAYRQQGNHIIASSIEHPAVTMPLKRLERKGYRITFLPVDQYGMVDPEQVKDALTKDTILVTIMHANNVFGTIQPISQIGELLRQQGIIFHTDAVQSFCNINTDVSQLKVDLLSLSGHKIYGPKGIGALYIRKGTKIIPQIFGGGQQRGVRSGTENVPAMAGLAEAARIGQRNLVDKLIRLTVMREYLISGLLDSVQNIKICGHPTKRLPGNCNFTLRNISGQALVQQLDQAGIAVSGSSACASSSLTPSATLMSLGLTCEEAVGSVRVTLGFENTLEEIDYFLKVLPPIIQKLRASPSI